MNCKMTDTNSNKGNNKRKKRLKDDLPIFFKKYARKRGIHRDPNDRQYDHRVKRKLKNIGPYELNELMNE